MKLDLSESSVALAERVSPLLQPDGALAHLLPKGKPAPSEPHDVLELLAKVLLERELDWTDGLPPTRELDSPGPTTASEAGSESDSFLSKATGEGTEVGGSEEAADGEEATEEGEEVGSEEAKGTGLTLSKKTIKRRQQRKRAKEKQAAEAVTADVTGPVGARFAPPLPLNVPYYMQPMCHGWAPVRVMVGPNGWANAPYVHGAHYYDQVQYEMCHAPEQGYVSVQLPILVDGTGCQRYGNH